GAGHFAADQRRHFLHRRRSTARRGDAQRMIGREPPFFATPTPTARALKPDRSKARLHRALVPVREAREFGATDGTDGRRLIGLFLSRFLGQGTFQIARLVGDLFFDVTQRVIAGPEAPVKTGRQTRSPIVDWKSKRLETAVGRNRNAAVI